jgi:hypothetical protein
MFVGFPLSISPGLVRLFPFTVNAALAVLSALSMVAGLMFINFSLMSGVIPKAGHKAMKGMCRLIGGPATFRTYTKKCPDTAQGSSNIIGIDFLPLRLDGLFSTT